MRTCRTRMALEASPEQPTAIQYSGMASTTSSEDNPGAPGCTAYGSARKLHERSYVGWSPATDPPGACEGDHTRGTREGKVGAMHTTRLAPRASCATSLNAQVVLPATEPALEMGVGLRGPFVQQLVGGLARRLQQVQVAFEIGEAQHRH